MNSLTVSSLELHVRNLLGDNANYTTSVVGEVAGNTWNTSQIIDALNFAIKEYCKKSSVTYTIASLSPNEETDGSGLFNEVKLPSDNLKVVRVTVPSQGPLPHVITGNGLLYETTKQNESARNPWWEFQTGTLARKWYRKDGRTIGIIPNINTVGFEDTVFMVGYVQAPALLTTSESISVNDLVVGQWYQIATEGDTDFSDVGGSVDSVVGDQFKATASDDSTGTVYEVVDPRIIVTHQEYLKYSAAAYLLNMNSDQQSLQLAERFQQIFNSLIGV